MTSRSDRPETWTAERLQQAAVDEAIKHGANEADLIQLRRQLAESNKPQLIDIEIPRDRVS